jgi:hypothetical protein
MKKLIPLLILPFATPAFANDMMIRINVNRVCASIVNIPYASDNFSDEEWKKFEGCRDYLRQFKDVE